MKKYGHDEYVNTTRTDLDTSINQARVHMLLFSKMTSDLVLS
jgi:hypothetical protein